MKKYIKLTKELRKEALKKWRLYNEAVKLTDLPIYKDLKKVYAQLKGGQTILDIHDVFKRSGVRENFHPKLAIAQASAKEICCRYNRDGNLAFLHDNGWRVRKNDIYIPDCMPKIPTEILGNQYTTTLQLKAPVPLVPPQFLPKKLTKNHFILWEVETWTKVPPSDPYLLRRITNNLFVVLAAWDLTPIERAAMKGRM